MSSNRIQNLRKKIQARTAELGITPQHDERGHWYRYKDQVYPSVTKKLSLIKDEALMSWKMNRALEYVEKALFNAKPNSRRSKNLKERGILGARCISGGKYGSNSGLK